jgi:LPXTG-site transpeptidase (sortase) family protein
MRHGKQKPMYYLGNALMALSFFILSAIYFPILAVFLGWQTKPDLSRVPTGTLILTINKIGATAPIYFDVNPWNKEEYQEILQKGIAHAKGTRKPGEEGTIYLFAHSTDQPWRITHYNTIFMKLNQLVPGDKIDIANNDKHYRYRVREHKIVSPQEIEYITSQSKNQLILQTCWPIGTDWKRLLVFAEPI